MDLTPRDEILLLGRNLPVGETDNKTLCFFCGGGQSKEKSFAVTRTDKLTIKYICHRANCRERGTILVSGGGESTAKKEYKFEPNHYTGIVHELEFQDLEYLDTKYGLDLNAVQQAGWSKAPGRGFGMFMPVFGPLGAYRGAVVRREFDAKSKEVRSFKALDENWLCWYRTSHSQIVLVEDQISALKAARFATTVALLGAELTSDKLDEILQNSKGKIWLALDRDAHKATFDYLKRYRGYCNGNFNALMLSKDIKNMSYKDIGVLLNEKSA